MIDMASVFAERFKSNPQMLQAAVLGQSPVPNLDAYTALRALQLLKESQQMQMAQAAQQPTNAPSLVDQAVARPQLPPQMMAQAAPQSAPQAVAQAAPAPVMQASGGLAGMPSGQHNYAPGGIVSFADKGAVEDDSDDSDSGGMADLLQQLMGGGAGDPATNAKLTAMLPKILGGIASYQPKQITEAEREAGVKKYMESLQGDAGASPYDAYNRQLAEFTADREKNLKSAEGTALLRAAKAAVQPGGTVRGLAAAASEYGESYGAALQADKAEKRALANMQFNLADAQRKERMGLRREAISLQNQAERDKIEADKAGLLKQRYLAELAIKGINVTRSPVAKAASLPQVDRQLGQLRLQIIDLENKNPNDPRLPVMKQQAAALSEVLAASKDYGPGKLQLGQAEFFRKVDDKAMDAVKQFKDAVADPAYKRWRNLSKSEKPEDRAAADEIIEKIKADTRNFYLSNPHLLGVSPSAAPAPAPAPSAAPAARAARPAPPAGFVPD